jgi:uncharacterized protein
MLNLIFSFSLFSVLGWLLEVLYRSLSNKRFVNPGLLKGPYLILYGVGGVVLFFLVKLCGNLNIFLKILIYGIITTFLELISGLIAWRIFNLRLWDYSENKFNYRGYICLKFSIYWTILALAFDYFIYPFYMNFISNIPGSTKFIFGFGVMLCMIVDLYKVIYERFFKYSSDELSELKQEFLDLISEYLKDPNIQKLKDSLHHRDKNRLEHVVEVAFYSFLIAKKMSLDENIIVKGAMLHDLFYYDWLREGPRLHGLRHPKISLENARKLYPISKKEADIIKKHMWPLTLMPPRYLESLVVSLVDSFCSARDYIPGWRKHLFKEELENI